MADVFSVGLHQFGNGVSVVPSANMLPNATWAPANTREGVVSLLSVIGTSVSIVGVVLTFITYSLFSDLRSPHGASLLSLLGSLFLAHLFSVIGVERPTPRTKNETLCLTLGFILHFLWLSVHAWLAAMCRHMYITFKLNMNLQPPVNFEGHASMIKTALFAWGVPGILTAVAAVIHHGTVLDREDLMVPTCWILGEGSLVWTFTIPAAIMALVDVKHLLGSAAFVRFTCGLQMTHKSREKMRRRRMLQVWLFTKLLVIFVLTWGLGAIAQVTQWRIGFNAFLLVASTQGFFVALTFSCSGRVFRLYSRSFRAVSKKHSPSLATDPFSAANVALLSWQQPPDAV